MGNSKICQAIFGASVILACLCACDSGAKDKTSGASSANLATNSQDLSKYRQAYAKPISQWAKPNIDESVKDEWQEFAPIPRAQAPKDNEFVHTKAHLGRNLFNEPRLSKSGQIACESCHHKEMASSDGLPRAIGHNLQIGRRNSPSTQMAAFFDELFWDGRAKSLEEQALAPITDPLEMANTLENAENAIKNAPEYYPLFVAAFGDETLKNAWAKYYPWIMPKNEQEEKAAKKAIHTHKSDESNTTKASANLGEKANLSANSNTGAGVNSNTDKKANLADINASKMAQKADLLGINKLEDLSARLLNDLKEQERALFGSFAYRKPLSDKPNPQSTNSNQPKIPQNLITQAQKLITIENIAKAIATFERGPGLMGAKNTRFERFLKGDYTALDDKELWGLDIFRNKGRCMNCHYGEILSDKKFHNVGLELYGRAGQDLGRYEVTQNTADIGAFKTPSLVNVSKTVPYFHNGIAPNLAGVIQLFNEGVNVQVLDDDSLNKGLNSANVAGKSSVKQKEIVKDKDGKLIKPAKSPLIQPLNLSADEIEALEAFLRTL